MRSGIMLCMPFEAKRLEKWRAPYILQPKLDGDRCRAIIDINGVCTLLSSEENAITSVPHINAALENLHLRNVEFDGELYVHGTPHPTIHSIVGRTSNIHSDFEAMQYHIFDIVTREMQGTRLVELFKNEVLFRDPLHLVPYATVDDLNDIMEASDQLLKEGYEGFVVRDAFGYYVRKRSTQLMKFKPRKEDYYTVVGYAEEIDKSGRPKGTLGALVCASDISNTTFNVGSGSLLTRDMRQELWNRRETLIGQTAQVKYQHISPVGHVPRFPVIVGLIDPMFTP